MEKVVEMMVDEPTDGVRPAPGSQLDLERLRKIERQYKALLEAVAPSGVMDKRTADEHHAAALKKAVWMQMQVEHLYEQCKALREKCGMPARVADILAAV